MATFKVTRTWYIEANKAVEAIERTRNFEHDEVSSKRVDTDIKCIICEKEID